MNDTTTTREEFVLRRLEEPLRLFGQDLNPNLWWGILLLLLLVGFVYIALMYLRDSRGVGLGWATLLGALRASVYLLIAAIFLLPALQTREDTRKESKVVVVFDVSGSIAATIDDLPDENTPFEKLLTRQDKVLSFLTNSKVRFFQRLEEKNPVTAYRFGRALDPEFRLFTEGRFWPRQEWETRLEQMRKNEPGPEGYPLHGEHLASWLKPEKPGEMPVSWKGDAFKADAAEWDRQVSENKKQTQAGNFAGTAVGDSVLSVMKREINNMVQGIVIFSDGRSTEGSAQAYKDLAEMATRSKIPLFVVAVGNDRQQVNIDIADLRVPPQIRPEDRFRSVVVVTGSGMDNEPLPRFDADPEEKKGLKGPRGYQIALDVSRVSRDKDNKEKEEDILIVTLDKNGEPTKEAPINLGKSVTLTQDQAKETEFVKTLRTIDAERGLKEAEVRFKPSTTGAPASAQVEWDIDAAMLVRATKREVQPGVRLGFLPDPNSEIRFKARVPKDHREILLAREHVSDPADMRVLKRPLRVLLFTAAASKEYQFIRSLYVREMDKNRAEVCIYLQPLPESERRTGRVQDVPPERLLGAFPSKLKAEKDAKPEDRFDALSSYDVIISLDADWSRIPREQLENVRKWVDQDGGGLIVLGGAINTVTMTRPTYKELLEPILTLLPVVLDDERVRDLERRTDRPWRLNFTGATPDMEFLRLWEPGDDDDRVVEAEKKGDVLASWARFFNTQEDENGNVQRRDNPETVPFRGFYSVYPSKSVKDGSQVIATFADPGVKMPSGKEQPFLAMGNYGKGKVVWLASAEMWRLRAYREAWNERFWTKLVRYVGGGSLNTLNKRITPVMSRTGVTNKIQTFEAKFEGRDGNPVPRDVRPEDRPVMTVTLPAGVTAQRGDRVRIVKTGENSGKEGKVLNTSTREGKTSLTVEIGGGDQVKRQVAVDSTEVEIIVPPLVMKPKLGTENDGWFEVEYQPKAAGEYKLQLKLEETGDTYLHKYIVKESNPELDNVRPDFEALYAIATEADPVLLRVNEETRNQLKKRLQRPRITSPGAKKDAPKPEGEKEEALKLYFDLNNADLIPACMDKDQKTLSNRGPVRDLWDEGLTLWTPTSPDKQPVKLSYMLCAIVGLLSLEWLIRKLLRLA